MRRRAPPVYVLRMARPRSLHLLPVLLAVLGGCPAPARPPVTGGARPDRDRDLQLEVLLREGRLRELERRIGDAGGLAEEQAPEIVGLLLAARGHVSEGLRLLERGK